MHLAEDRTSKIASGC